MSDPRPQGPVVALTYLRLEGAQLAAWTASLAVLVLASGLVCTGLPRSGGLSPIWIGNAFVAAAMIRTARRSWPPLIAAGILANVAVLSFRHYSGPAAAWLMLANSLEFVLAGTLFAAWTRRRPGLSHLRFFARLALVSAGVAALSAAAASTTIYFFSGLPPLAQATTWWLAHGLGLITITPCLLLLSRPSLTLPPNLSVGRAAAALAVLVVVGVLVFAQSRYPLLFLIPPALLLVSLELESFGAAAGVLLVEALELASLYTHSGPMMLVSGAPLEKAAVGQIFLLTALASSVPVALLSARRRQAFIAARTSELNYRLLADNASDMITRLDARGAITFITPVCTAVLGYTAEEMIGRRVIDITHPEDAPGVLAYYQALMAKGPGAASEPFSFRAQRKDGEWIWLEGQPRLFFGDEGQLTSIQDVARDVTKRKALEVALESARAEAEAAAAVKSEFLSNMSHELRTPLTSILGFSAMLSEERALSDLGQRAVQRVNGASEALLTIVNDILDFSKLEARQVEIDPRAVDPAAVLQGAASLLEPQCQAKGLRLTFIEAGALPPFVMMDDARVRQVVLNLVGNALKFTSLGEVSLCASYDEAAGRLRVEVADTGPGIAPDRLGRLFQRFSQVDASTTRAFGGTGLGLAICRGLIEAMGGEVGVSSVLGEGSRFWFEAPCPVAAAPQASASDVAEPAAALEGVRLLVVDDNPTNRELVRLMLTPLGVEITEAETGEEAVAQAATWPFDLILMDLRMPGMGGVMAAEAIRATGGPSDDAPILAFTADAVYGETPDTPPGLFDDQVAKPIVPATLIGTLALWAAGGPPQAAPQALRA